MSQERDVVVLGLKKVHIVIVALTAIVTPSVVVTASFYKARSEIDQKIDGIQLQNVQTFARNEDVRKMNEQLSQIHADIAEIKGYLRIRHQRKYEE